MSVNLANKTAVQSITSTAAALSFGATLENESGAFDLGTSAVRATVLSEYAGRYGKVSAQYAVNFTYNEIDIRKNGASFPGAGRQLGYSAGVNAECVNSAPVLLSGGDYFEAFLRNISTTADTTDNELNWLQLHIMPVDFKGALVTKTVTQTLSNGVWTALSWDSEQYDLSSFHDNAVNNSRMTIPLGVTLVRVAQGVHRSNASSSDISITTYKNGVAGTAGFPLSETSGNSSIAHYLTGVSAPLAVTPGDYLEAYCNSSVASTIIENSNYSWFSIEVLPSDLKYALVAKTTNQSIPSTTNTNATFNSEVVDVGGWFDGSTSTERLVVPSGVKKVRLTANINRASASGQCIAFIFKNGALAVGMARRENDTSGTDALNIQTGVIPVSPGDYFDLRVWFNAASNLLGSGGTWFSIEEVRDDAVSISPAFGPVAGGSSVTITGDGFLSATGVLFDTDAATDVVVVNNLEITCTIPAHAAGTVDVTVQRPSTDIVLPASFIYSADPAPTFTSLTPDHGPIAGGTAVTMIGDHFLTVTDVELSGISVDNLVIVDAQTITFDAPAGTEGKSDLRITSTAGIIDVPEAYAYLSDMVITQLPIMVASKSPGKIRITQLPIMVASKPSQPTRITQVPISTAFPLDATPVLPMIPQWPVRETLSWLTSMVTSRQGYEQRMGLRVDPDVRFELTIPMISQEERQQAFNTLYRYVGTRIEYPLFQYRTPIRTDAMTGEVWLDVSTVLGNFRAGEAVYIFDRTGSIWQRAVVDSVSDSPEGITLRDPLTADVMEEWLIAPAPVCRIPDNSAMGLDAGDNGSMFLDLTLVPPRTLLRPDQPTSSLLTTFDSLSVLPDHWVGAEINQEVFLRGVDVLEGVSNRVDIRNWSFTQRAVPRKFAIEKEDLDYWRAFLSSVSGRRVPFLMPSLMSDFTVSPPALGATVLVTSQTEIAEYMRSKAIRWLQIERQDGSIIYRRVTNCVLEMNRTVSITLNASIGASAGNNLIRRISLMSLSRLSDDNVVLDHYISHIEITFSAQTVEQ